MNTHLLWSNTIYILCALTALACTVFLLRGYIRSKVRMLLWAGLCFALLFINNVLVFVDVVTMPEINLSLWRTIPALFGIALLIYGLLWEGSRNE